MSDRRVVYKGPSGLGDVIIYEGDSVKFELTLFESTSIQEGNAYYSEDYTRGNTITFRMPHYGPYRFNDCHSSAPWNLIVLRHKNRTGFGDFIRKIEGATA